MSKLYSRNKSNAELVLFIFKFDRPTLSTKQFIHSLYHTYNKLFVKNRHPTCHRWKPTDAMFGFCGIWWKARVLSSWHSHSQQLTLTATTTTNQHKKFKIRDERTLDSVPFFFWCCLIFLFFLFHSVIVDSK